MLTRKGQRRTPQWIFGATLIVALLAFGVVFDQMGEANAAPAVDLSTLIQPAP